MACTGDATIVVVVALQSLWAPPNYYSLKWARALAMPYCTNRLAVAVVASLAEWESTSLDVVVVADAVAAVVGKRSLAHPYQTPEVCRGSTA